MPEVTIIPETGDVEQVKPSKVSQQDPSKVQQPLRTRKTDGQLKVLREFFRKCRYPSRQEKLELSQKTGLNLSKVRSYFTALIFCFCKSKSIIVHF